MAAHIIQQAIQVFPYLVKIGISHNPRWISGSPFSVYTCLNLDNPVAIRFFVTFGEISYLFSNMKNRNDQEPGPILTGNFI